MSRIRTKPKEAHIYQVKRENVPRTLGLDSLAPLVRDDCSSATKDVVILSKGTLNNLETRLKTETDTPTAANSTDPTR